MYRKVVVEAMKIIATLRNNWKKTVAGVGFTIYGVNYLYEKKVSNELLQAYCIESLRYSKVKVGPTEKIKRVTVFLNPVGANNNSKTLYDKYVHPILQLSGLDVRLIRLDNKKEASEFMNILDENTTDAIVIAGGNGTIQEVVSTLVNRPDAEKIFQKVQIGIIPVGERNSLAKKIFSINQSNEVKLLGEATMAIINGQTKPIDMMKINLIDKIDASNKIVYALSSLSCGFESEKVRTIDEYWLYGPLKTHMNEYFNKRIKFYRPNDFNMLYIKYCPSCKKCFDEKNKDLIEKVQKLSQNSSSFMYFIFKKFIYDNKEAKQLNIKREQQLINEDCGCVHELKAQIAQIDANINHTNDDIGIQMDIKTNKNPEVRLNLDKFEFQSINSNANALLIDEELYDLNLYNRIYVEYLKDSIKLLMDEKNKRENIQDNIKLFKNFDFLKNYLSTRSVHLLPFKAYF